MTTITKSPSLYIISGGKLVQKSPTKIEPSPPKTIHYTHTVRMMNGNVCRCSEEINQLKLNYQREISEKNHQITRLMNLLSEKDEILKMKDDEIFQMKEKFQTKNIKAVDSQKPHENQVVKDAPFKIIKDLTMVLPKMCQTENPLITKVKKEMKNTMQALENITNNLNKPKRKYQFYNTCLDTVRPPQSQISSGESPYNLNESYIDMIEQTRILESQIKDGDQDLDITFEDESQDHVGFLQKLLKQHKQLKQTLLNLQQSTQMQMQELKSFYQNQIQMYISMLSKQNDKDQFYNLNSTRTNIEIDSSDLEDEDKAQECESDQYFEWGKENRFQIIFPSDQVLAPDILE